VAAKPVVRYMVLCDDWGTDPNQRRKVNIFGLLTNIRSLDEPPYPLLYRELCVLLVLTEGRRSGEAKIACVFEDNGQEVWTTPKRKIEFGPDPLEVVAVPFRIRDARFPYPGLYSIQLWYDDELVQERPVRLR
jgi:hypothetical protein